MPKLLDASILEDNEKFLFYGEPKTGKTFAALTAPDPIWAIAIGNTDELTTRFSKEFKAKYPNKEIYFDVVEEDEDWVEGAPEGYDRFVETLNRGIALDEDPEEDFSFRTLVVDNATQLGNFAMYKAMMVNYDDARSKNKTALNKLRTMGIIIPADNDWMSQMSLMGQTVSFLFRMKKNIVLIAHEWQDKTTDRATHSEKIQAVKPLFTGKQRTEIPGLFSNVWRFEKTGQFFEARTVGTDNPMSIVAGTRIGGVLPERYRDVDLEEAIGKLHAEARR